MRASERDEDEPTPPDDEFELPLPDQESGGGRRLRRRLFGLRAREVEAEISERNSDVAELRRDVAALWLAFGQHERTIRQLLEAIERIADTSIDPPGAAPATPAAAEAPPSRQSSPHDPSQTGGSEPAPGAAVPDLEPLASSIGDQLSDLDEVLGAIERATRSLERSYAEEIAAAERGGQQAQPADPPAADAGDEPQPPASAGESGEHSS